MESILFGNSLVIPEKGVQFSSVAQSCLTLCDPMDGSTPGLPVHHHLPRARPPCPSPTPPRQASLFITNSQSSLKLTSIESMMPSNHLILCSPLLLPPSIFPSIRVVSNESVLPSGGQSIGVSALTSSIQ